MTLLLHAPCCYAQDHRPPVPAADLDGCFLIPRQVDVLALSCLQPFGADGGD